MKFFEYPYVIITVLAMIIFIMGLVGFYFTMKSVRTAKGQTAKSFVGTGKMESELEKALSARERRTVLYISLSLDNVKRLYSESKAGRIYEQIKRALLNRFAVAIEGNIALYGKESFVATLPLSTEEASGAIEASFEDINEILTKNGAVGSVRVSFGVFSTSATDVTFKTALSRAKQACTMAEDGDTLWCEWDSGSGKKLERQMQIENNIQSEIDNNRFFLEYQPIINAKTNEIMGAEVLSRLNSDTEGVLTPYAFLSAVNNVGLNEKFDYYIFEKNIKWIANDKEKRSSYVYTINFSRSTLCDEGFAENLIGIIEKYKIDYSCIAVEILEDKTLSSAETALMVENIKKLKGKGILILLDDFGKGYTSFGDLSEFDIDIVKIDKAIVQGAENETGFLILKNIIRTAHDLGFRALCEGIETEKHKKIAVEAGCDALQGYYFYRPMPVVKLEALFEKE